MSQIFMGQYPYDGYKVYVEYHSKENRRYAILNPIDKSKKLTSMSYARYLMSVKEGRILHSDEQVDHIDNNPMNDDINNLQILTPNENRKKQAEATTKAYVKLKCPMCGKIFIKDKGHVHLLYGKASYCACSRSCSTKLAALVFHNKISKEEFTKRISDNFIEEFYI